MWTPANTPVAVVTLVTAGGVTALQEQTSREDVRWAEAISAVWRMPQCGDERKESGPCFNGELDSSPLVKDFTSQDFPDRRPARLLNGQARRGARLRAPLTLCPMHLRCRLTRHRLQRTYFREMATTNSLVTGIDDLLGGL